MESVQQREVAFYCQPRELPGFFQPASPFLQGELTYQIAGFGRAIDAFLRTIHESSTT
jgi:hypothetical protein